MSSTVENILLYTIAAGFLSIIYGYFTGKNLGIKISKIGKICKSKDKSKIINENNKKITLKNKGYFHKF